MRPRSSCRRLCGPLAVCTMLLQAVAAQAQINPFRSLHGPSLSAEDQRLLFESADRLNAAAPVQVGRSESWRNPQTNDSGTSTVLRVFRSDGMPCHLVRHHIVVAGQPGRDYQLTWCRTPAGEWKTKED